MARAVRSADKWPRHKQKARGQQRAKRERRPVRDRQQDTPTQPKKKI